MRHGAVNGGFFMYEQVRGAYEYYVIINRLYLNALINYRNNVSFFAAHRIY
ncbi:hypothetical protein EBL_c12650 [Shimwellia blattae DSM 4481 = NBRC 105725]|uniref:Uncharacterized protein n=1 Tax=Shimwellia blattae (strain ATCC 29907 / DSM 4481 / JCM 1650 / NBRC 105725 / CDC 9005-74) TaxID=630626 RepID=I2B764_SHIBC|nr:hypothetical protein EBL_c12650 [Shimwellia blattae DSM 4481 = NBRC 105725]